METARHAARTLKRHGYSGPTIQINNPEKYLHGFRKPQWEAKAIRLFHAYGINCRKETEMEEAETPLWEGQDQLLQDFYIRQVRRKRLDRYPCFFKQVVKGHDTIFVPDARNEIYLEAFNRIIH